MRRCCRPKRSSQRARALAAKGADVVDLGGLPDTDFPQLEAAVRLLKSAGLRVSVDSFSVDELRRGAAAGADYLLSLNEETLDLAFETGAVPVLVPARAGDLASLQRAAARMEAAGPRLYRRSRARADPFRLHRLDRALRRLSSHDAAG